MRKLKTKYLWLKAGLVILILYVGDASNLRCLVQPSYVPIGRESLQGLGHVYLVPLAAFPRPVLERYEAFYKNNYGLDISILPAVSVSLEAFNQGRQQFVAEQLNLRLQQMKEALHLESDSTIIGLTDLDMYIDQYHWRYAYSYRSGKSAVVSSAQMNSPFMKVWPISNDWLETRVRKLVTQEIAIVYYHLPLSDHCRSPVFGGIGGPEEVDFMGEKL